MSTLTAIDKDLNIKAAYEKLEQAIQKIETNEEWLKYVSVKYSST